MKLHNDFGIDLPQPEEGTDFSDYLENVSKVLSASEWNVANDVSQLSLFTFMKINMYRDLERNSEKIYKHNIIKAINGEKLSNKIDASEISGFNHDNTDPQEIFSVMDADSSQQDAILLAKKGASFILWGPPGTGKSQTITNIIAELLADGKKVLFVSEKTAALDVVYKRLTQAGLSDFCLILHSDKAKPREILAQFDRSIKMSRTEFSLQANASNDLYNLKETRKALSQYIKELYTVIEPLGMTIWQANGSLAELEDYPNINYVNENAETFTSELLAKCISGLAEVTRIVSKSGYQQNNPWDGCILEEPPTFRFRQHFLVDAENLVAQVKRGLSILDETNTILDNEGLEWFFSEIAAVKKIFSLAKLSPQVNPAWVMLNLQSTISDLDACVNYIKVCENLKNDTIAMNEIGERINSAIQDETAVQIEQEVSTEIASAVLDFNNALRVRGMLTNEKSILVTAIKETNNKLLTCKPALEKEEAKRVKAAADWKNAQRNLFARCDEDVLYCDAANML